MNIQHKLWWWSEGGASNNSSVQAWLDKGDSLGRTLPAQGTIDALNTFFDSIDSIISLAECIRFYGLNDNTLEQIARLNFIDPDTYQATLVNSPVYSVNGFKSNGTTSYIDSNVPVNRRANIQKDFSTACYVFESAALAANKALFGAYGNTKFMSVEASSGVNLTGYPYGNVINVADTNFQGMHLVKTKTGDNTRGVYIRNGVVYGNNLNSAASASDDVFELAYNLVGAPTNRNDACNVGFMWYGYSITEAQEEILRNALVQYKSDVGL